MDHAELQSEIPGVLGAWGIRATSSVSPVPGGTLNFNFDVRADGARCFLRCYRANLETERIAVSMPSSRGWPSVESPLQSPSLRETARPSRR